MNKSINIKQLKKYIKIIYIKIKTFIFYCYLNYFLAKLNVNLL